MIGPVFKSQSTPRVLKGMLSVLLGLSFLFSGGISVDAGLTPAANRWLVRFQVRQMEMELGQNKMATDAYVFMAAYGLKPGLTVIAMQGMMKRESTMMGMKSKTDGLADLNLLAKYKVFRRNTRLSTVGIAATAKFTVPTGDKEFSSDYWSFTPGIFMSYRKMSWAIDLSSDFVWRDIFNSLDDDKNTGGEFTLNGALAKQIPVGTSTTAIAPVIEFNYSRTQPDYNSSTPEPDHWQILFLSPGMKWTYDSLILELLVQLPVWEDIPSGSMENLTRGRIGFRYMF